MKKILDMLRKNREIYEPLRKIYGNTLGMWKIKKWFISEIGLYNGRKRVKLIPKKRAENIIGEKIRSGNPFMLTRYGTGEFRSLFNDKDLNLIYFYSGFFPKEAKLLPKFRETYTESSKQIDILAISLYKNQFIRKIKWIRRFPNIEYFIPFNSINNPHNPWIKELENKKVLIIHPFKKTIEKQYIKRKKLKILPKLKDLEVIRAVQTLAGNKDERFETWFEALEYMKKEIDKKDFDIAIIGCGAYGLPLAAHIKSLGKQALHLGGSLQLLFGIKGKRWAKKITFNKYWRYPLKEDCIPHQDKIEGGCYW